jgi:hypothetical protein
MSEFGSSFGKWLGGILATVITGLLLWWLTGPSSPLVHKSNVGGSDRTVQSGTSTNPVNPTDDSGSTDAPAKQQAIISISKFNVKSPINIGETTTCDFDVTNTGNATATDCQIIWETEGLNGNKTTEKFDLSPQETKSFELTSNPYNKDGTYNTVASVSSGNAATVTDQKPLVVNFMMSAPSRHIQ